MSSHRNITTAPANVYSAWVWCLLWFGAAAVSLIVFSYRLIHPTLTSTTEITSPDMPPTSIKAVGIEKVRPGDYAWAYDPISRTWAAKRVLATMNRPHSGTFVTVIVAGQRLETTADHPFWVCTGHGLSVRPKPAHVDEPAKSEDGGRWVDARHLSVGDVLATKTRGAVIVEGVELHLGQKPVYNLEVAGLHTYAVGIAGIAVHNCPKCFAPGTFVLMGNGERKPIEMIVPGESVLTIDPAAPAHVVPHTVSARLQGFTNCLVLLTLGRGWNEVAPETLASTPKHPFWTVDRGWVFAKDLYVGERLRSADGSEVFVAGTSRVSRYSATYNLTVDGTHTFFVTCGRASSLVHNAIMVSEGDIMGVANALNSNPGNIGIGVVEYGVNPVPVTMRPAGSLNVMGSPPGGGHFELIGELGLGNPEAYQGFTIVTPKPGVFDIVGVSGLNDPDTLLMDPKLLAELKDELLPRFSRYACP